VGSPSEEMGGHGHGERRTGKKTVENEEEVCGCGLSLVVRERSHAHPEGEGRHAVDWEAAAPRAAPMPEPKAHGRGHRCHQTFQSNGMAMAPSQPPATAPQNTDQQTASRGDLSRWRIRMSCHTSKWRPWATAHGARAASESHHARP